MFGQNANIVQAILFLVAILVSVTFHEFTHAWSANELGDPTARRMGRMTLNPIKHFDPLGALMIVFMAFARVGIGWGKPVPVNPYNLRGNPRVSMGLTSAAGPYSNLVLAALFAIPLRLGLPLPALVETFFWTMVVTNLSLAVFNLLPLPPLDGFGVLQGLLGTLRTRWSYEWGERLDRVAPYGPMLLLALLAFGWFGGLNILGAILGPPVNALLRLLVG
jgi:Zn-dependent protease